MDIALESVLPLVTQQELRGETLHCTFTCPTTKISVESRARVVAGSGLSDRVSSEMKKSMSRALRRRLSRLIRRVFGGGFLGRIAADAARDALDANVPQPTQQPNQSDREHAIVAAFEAVASSFVFDPESGRWTARPVQAAEAVQEISRFEQQISMCPIEKQSDRELLARVLVEVAAADEAFTPEEQQFVEEFVPTEFGSVRDLHTKPKLGDHELAAVSSPDVAETIFMLACALACNDQEVDPREEALLQRFSAGMGLGEDVAGARRLDAARYVIEQLLWQAYWGGLHNEELRGHAQSVARSMGMSDTDFERFDEAYRRTNNVV